MLKRMGAGRVIGIEPVKPRRALSARYGADESVDVVGQAATDAVLDLTDGDGADVVIEAVGSTATLNQAFDLVRQDGQVVLFGLPETDEPVPFRFETFFKKRASAFTVLGAQDEAGLASFKQAVDWITSGQVNVAPVLTHTKSIEQVGDAFELAVGRTDGVVKVGLTF